MPQQDHGKQIKNDEQYEELRDQGYSKEKSARIANTSDASSKGGQNPAYEEWTRDELEDKAREIGIEGHSQMNKGELIDALRG